MISFNEGIFEIDPSSYCDRLISFIKERKKSLHRDGILVPFSGGLDSSTVLLLCRKAVKPDELTALLMPEKQGNPEAMTYSYQVCKNFHIQTLTRDISSILAHLGSYRFILSKLPSRATQDWLAKKYFRSNYINPFLKIMQGQANNLERKGYSKYMSKHRIRAVVAYLVAEENNLLVVGSAQKTEKMLGLFVKFGVDDLADLMPLKNLYRSQIIPLARFLKVPNEIIERTPNPDIIPGVEDKYRDLLGLPCEIIDLILYGIEHEMSIENIAAQLKLPRRKVQEIRMLVDQTAHMRNPSQSVDWE